jgi:hypothetical protein
MMIPELILAAFAATTAQQQPDALSIQTGGDIVRVCQGRDTAETDCLTWFSGVLHGIDAQQQLARGERVICLPTAVSVPRLRDVVLDFIRRHPDLLDVHAGGIAHTALRLAFPCPGNPG